MVAARANGLRPVDGPFGNFSDPDAFKAAAARAAVLRRAAEEGHAPGPITVTEPAERDLVLLLDAFDQALVDAYDKKAPNFLAEHAYKLAQAFSKFYGACPILAAPSPELRASRLSLAQTVLRQLELALDDVDIADVDEVLDRPIDDEEGEVGTHRLGVNDHRRVDAHLVREQLRSALGPLVVRQRQGEGDLHHAVARGVAVRTDDVLAGHRVAPSSSRSVAGLR